MLDTSDGLELSVPGESEYVMETETEKEIEKNNVCPKLFEQELVSSAKVFAIELLIYISRFSYESMFS